MRLQILIFIASLLMPGPSFADTRYPDRPIRFIVPFGAGSDTDLYARNLAGSVNRMPGMPDILVENQPGDSGSIASLAVRTAPADGYTLLIGRVATHAIQPALNPQLPYRWHDFTILGILELDPLICAVGSDSPYKTVRELLAAIRQAPGTLKYSTAGRGTIHNLSVQYMLSLAGLKPAAALGMHFNNGLDATHALLKGDVQFICNLSGSMIPQIKAGALRGLFTTAPGRMAALPQLPNAREVGLRDMARLVGWTALIGPAKLPELVTRRWKEILGKVATDPQWLAGNAQLGGLPALASMQNPERYVREQYTLYDQLITTLEIRQ